MKSKKNYKVILYDIYDIVIKKNNRNELWFFFTFY